MGEQIELRSSNARRFIKEEPPFIIRYGTMIIVLLLIFTAVGIYFYTRKASMVCVF